MSPFYSLKKWAGLACRGNPTALHFLFAESFVRNAIWTEIMRDRTVFLVRTFVKPFVGFADDQLKRMTGGKGRGKKGQRPEIEEKYGYDLKAAMHTLRLLDLNETFSFAYALGNIRWTKSSRWRRRCLENARKRPSPRFCPIGLIERQYRAF
jgi:hypothetical protein